MPSLFGLKGLLLRYAFATVFVFVFSVLFILVALLEGAKVDQLVDAAYANGLITASGIFLGFTMAAAIARGKELERRQISTVEIALLVFAIAILALFRAEIKGRVTVTELVFLQASFFFNLVAAYEILRASSKQVSFPSAGG